MSTVSELVNQLIDDLETRPDDFECNDCFILDNTTKRQFKHTKTYSWDSGEPGLHEPYKIPFGIWQAWRLKCAVRRWQLTKVINKEETQDERESTES